MAIFVKVLYLNALLINVFEKKKFYTLNITVFGKGTPDFPHSKNLEESRRCLDNNII